MPDLSAIRPGAVLALLSGSYACRHRGAPEGHPRHAIRIEAVTRTHLHARIDGGPIVRFARATGQGPGVWSLGLLPA